jgi:hypothetical protein
MMQSRTFKDMWKSSLSLDKSFDHLKNAEKFIFPLNDITKICFGKIVEWLDNHDGQPDPVIEEDPITTEANIMNLIKLVYYFSACLVQIYRLGM